MWHWLATWLGLTDPSGPQYLAWSGFIGQITIIAGAVALYRKHTCDVNGCHRLARHTTRGNHHVCVKHSPEHGLTHQLILDAHEAAKGVKKMATKKAMSKAMPKAMQKKMAAMEPDADDAKGKKKGPSDKDADDKKGKAVKKTATKKTVSKKTVSKKSGY